MLQRMLVGMSAIAVVCAPALVWGADFALTDKNTTVKFVGSKPQGKHEGGFKKVTGAATVQGTDATTLKISLDIDMDSLYSDNDKLTAHLKSPDFFGVKSNPKSKFVSTKVEKAGNEYKITGDLTMLGKTKTIVFPAVISVDGGLSLTSTFAIDKSQWGMTYGTGKINNAVTLTIGVNAK